jgi:hypothetical protein
MSVTKNVETITISHTRAIFSDFLNDFIGKDLLPEFLMIVVRFLMIEISVYGKFISSGQHG